MLKAVHLQNSVNLGNQRSIIHYSSLSNKPTLTISPGQFWVMSFASAMQHVSSKFYTRTFFRNDPKSRWKRSIPADELYEPGLGIHAAPAALSASDDDFVTRLTDCSRTLSAERRACLSEQRAFRPVRKIFPLFYTSSMGGPNTT